MYIYIPYIYAGAIKIDYMSLNLKSFAINHMLYHYGNLLSTLNDDNILNG